MSRSRVAAANRGSASIWSVVRIGSVAALAYSVATATPAQRSAMLEGARALVSSIQDACLRTVPCHAVVNVARTTASDILASHEPSRGRTFETKGAARPVPLLER